MRSGSQLRSFLGDASFNKLAFNLRYFSHLSVAMNIVAMCSHLRNSFVDHRRHPLRSFTTFLFVEGGAQRKINH